MEHPSKEIMHELIEDQWVKDSIYAAVVDPDGNIVSKGHTTVWEDHDPVSHAEINAIREACKVLKKEILPPGYWL